MRQSSVPVSSCLLRPTRIPHGSLFRQIPHAPRRSSSHPVSCFASRILLGAPLPNPPCRPLRRRAPANRAPLAYPPRPLPFPANPPLGRSRFLQILRSQILLAAPARSPGRLAGFAALVSPPCAGEQSPPRRSSSAAPVSCSEAPASCRLPDAPINRW